MAWNYRQYGSPSDPIHKSHLNDITGDYGCPTRFRYAMDARAEAGGVTYDVSRPVRGDTACGTATHETIARILVSEHARPRVLAGPGAITRANVERAFAEEFERETSGRSVEWYDRSGDDVRADCVTMILGLLDNLHRYVHEVVLVEPAFVVRLGQHWLSGHIDLLYRPRRDPSALGIADWKTGVRRPHPIVIDHSWESGVYSVAARDGLFLPRERLKCERESTTGLWRVEANRLMVTTHPSRYIAERECAELVLSGLAAAIERLDTGWRPSGVSAEAYRRSTLGGFERFAQFPTEVFHVHLQDYVPYKRAGKKSIDRPEDLAFYQRHSPGAVHFKPGDVRGPAWLPVRLTEHDVPRVAYRLKNVVGMIRMGRFIDQIGERCARCPYAGDCLTGGYALPTERRNLERSLSADDVQAAGELVIDD